MDVLTPSLCFSLSLSSYFHSCFPSGHRRGFSYAKRKFFIGGMLADALIFKWFRAWNRLGHTYMLSHTDPEPGQRNSFFFLFFQVFARLQNSGFCSQMWTVNIKPSICKLYPRNRQDKEKECAKTHMWLSILLSWHLDFTVVNVVFLQLTKAAKMTSISGLKNSFRCYKILLFFFLFFFKVRIYLNFTNFSQ